MKKAEVPNISNISNISSPSRRNVVAQRHHGKPTFPATYPIIG